MEDFNGIISLLVACIEIGLFVNLLIFAEKNCINKLAITLIGLLMTYQLLEFVMCFVELQTAMVVYLALFSISLMPPLALFLVLRFNDIKSKAAFLIFIPALYFVFYYLYYLDTIAVTKCTVMYAVYNYPLGVYYGTFYYLPILASIIFLAFKLNGEDDQARKNLNIILLVGYVLTFFPGLIINLFVPGAFEFIESNLCKIAMIFAISHALFVLKNRNIN